MKKKILQGIIIGNILLLLIVGYSINIIKEEEKISDKREQEKLVYINSDELINNEQKELSIIEEDKETKREKKILADKGEIFTLYIKDNALYMSYRDESIFLNKVDINMTQTGIQYNVLYSDKNEMYVVVYYTYLHCGGAGQYIPFHVVKIDKIQEELNCIFDEGKVIVKSKFIKDKLYLTINDAEELILDTSHIINNLGYEKKKDLISKNTISVGSSSTLEVNDFVGNNTKQLFIRCQVKDIIGSIELGYVYMVLQIKFGEIQILKVFEEDLNNAIVNSIGKNSYWRITDEDKNKDLINRLIENNVVRKQGEFLVFSFNVTSRSLHPQRSRVEMNA